MLSLGDSYLDLLYYGVAVAFSGYFYTGYPLRLVARKGLGELLIGLNFGPLMTMGTVFAMSGIHSWDAFILGIPLGLLTTAILWINQFPDMKSDEIAGKHHLVVVLGLEKSSWGFLLIIISAFISIIAINYYEIVNNGVLLSLLALPLAIVGLIDDYKGLSTSFRLIFQAIIASLFFIFDKDLSIIIDLPSIMLSLHNTNAL